MLKVITIGVPLLLLVTAAIGGIAYEQLSADRTKWAFADVYRALEGDTSAQRRLANCYKVGCTYAPPDPVYECAWRQVILQELGPNKTAADEREERRSCANVHPSDRQFISIARKEIDRQMKQQNAGRKT